MRENVQEEKKPVTSSLISDRKPEAEFVNAQKSIPRNRFLGS